MNERVKALVYQIMSETDLAPCAATLDSIKILAKKALAALDEPACGEPAESTESGSEFTKNMRYKVLQEKSKDGWACPTCNCTLNYTDLKVIGECPRQKHYCKYCNTFLSFESLRRYLVPISLREIIEACDIIDRLEQELSLYRRNFCEDHQPLDIDTYKGCYACDLVHEHDLNKEQADEIKRLKEALEKYGTHTDYCNLMSLFPCRIRNGKKVGCTCGFEQALKEKDKQ